MSEQSGELVKALQEEADWVLGQPDYVGSPNHTASIMRQAADEIERLRRINEAYTATVAANKGDIHRTQSGELVKRLKRIADCDYKEPDPRTGNYYEREGETIMEAAARIQELEKELENEWHRAEENEHWRKVMEAENARLREALRAIVRSYDEAPTNNIHGGKLTPDMIARAALQGEKE